MPLHIIDLLCGDMDIDSFIDPIFDVINELIQKIDFYPDRIGQQEDSNKYKEQFKEIFGDYTTPHQGLHAFQYIEIIVDGIKTRLTKNPSTNDRQRLTNKTANEVADFIIEMCQDIQSMLEIMCDKRQTDRAGLLELTLQSYPRITYTNCNKSTLETARTNQIKALKHVVFAQINSEQALQRELAASEAENKRLQVSIQRMSEEKDKQGGFKVAQADMGEIRGLLCELGSL
jgi:hypothetical protein